MPDQRIIKGRPFGVGFDRSLQRGYRILSKSTCQCSLILAFGLSSATIGAWKELIPMAIDLEHLKHFQSEQLEQKNIQTSARIPIHARTIEWALIEIVILLTGISDSLKRMADRP